jgi:hypothetical protein
MNLLAQLKHVSQYFQHISNYPLSSAYQPDFWLFLVSIYLDRSPNAKPMQKGSQITIAINNSSIRLLTLTLDGGIHT